MNLYSFNEHSNARTNWKRDIDNINVMKILNIEIAANSFKATRWIAQSLLADVDFINFALTTRKSMNDPSKGHQVMAVLRNETTSWAKSLNMSLDRGWRTIQYLCTIIENDTNSGPVAEGEDADERSGEYILMKDFNSMKLNLFKKPQ